MKGMNYESNFLEIAVASECAVQLAIVMGARRRRDSVAVAFDDDVGKSWVDDVVEVE